MQDLEGHVCVCDDEGEGLFEGEEGAGQGFETVFGAPEEEHFVGFFLRGRLVVCLLVEGWREKGETNRVACEPEPLEGVAHH